MLSMRFWLPVVLVLTIAPIAPAQAPPAKPGDAMIEKYLTQETERLSQRVLDGAKTLEEWQARRPRLKEEYLYMLGLWPLPEKTPLQATVTGTRERDGVVIEKLHFQSKPGLYVTGNLYRPKASRERERPEKLPAVLYVCGHSGRGRDGNKTAFQDHGMWFATHGYVCLLIDTLQLGEIPGVHHGTYGRPYLHLKAYGIKDKDVVENRWWWQAAGYAPSGVECWNGIRAIDYLISRPDVDAERIAVTGISGGGAATFWIAAADERVKCAVPVSGMSDLESYVTNKVINGHCDCMFLINTYQWEWTTIATLVAPRPLLFANSDNDRIFPMDGNRRIIERLRKLYGMYGRPELVDEYVSKGGHDYRPDLRVAIFKWINKHIKNDTAEVKDADFQPLPGKELRVFLEDKDIPKDAINGQIDETFVPRAQVKLPEAGKFDEWKKTLMKELREKSFRAFPEQILLGKKPYYFTEQERLTGVSLLTDLDARVSLHSRPGKDRKLLEERVLIVLGSDEDTKEVPEWAKPLIGDTGAGLVAPRGVGLTTWARKSPPNYVERAHALLGNTVDQGRVEDVAAMARFVAGSDDKRKVKLLGRGQAGILALYAALFEPSIGEVVIIDPPASHREGPIFLNVLRVLDIPEALGMLAPTPLTLVNAKDKAFDRTAEIYKRAGAAEKLQRR